MRTLDACTDTINAMNSISSINRHDSDTGDNGQTELDELLDDMTRAREGNIDDVAIWKRCVLWVHVFAFPTNRLQIMYRSCTYHVQIMCRIYTDYIQIIYRSSIYHL